MTVPLPDPLIVDGSTVEPWGVQRNFEALAQAIIDLRGLVFFGTGSPENVVTANPGAIYLNYSGGAGTTLYVKESNTDDTGWVGK